MEEEKKFLGIFSNDEKKWRRFYIRAIIGIIALFLFGMLLEWIGKFV